MGEYNREGLDQGRGGIARLQLIAEHFQDFRVGKKTGQRNVYVLVFEFQPAITKTAHQPHHALLAGIGFEQFLAQGQGRGSARLPSCHLPGAIHIVCGDAINTVAERIVAIVGELVGHQHDDAHANGHRYRQAQDVDR